MCERVYEIYNFGYYYRTQALRNIFLSLCSGMYNRGDYLIDFLIMIVITEEILRDNRNRNLASEFLRLTTQNNTFETSIFLIFDHRYDHLYSK